MEIQGMIHFRIILPHVPGFQQEPLPNPVCSHSPDCKDCPYAHDGFGCSPHAIGRSVRCTCLGDSEMTRWNRNEFIGVLDDNFLPEWAKPKLAELQAQEQTVSPTSRDDEALDCLESLPFTVAFVDGNHENFDALATYRVEEWHSGKIQCIRPHVLHLMRGQVYELEGYRFFTLGGAMSHDTDHRINHISWWQQELPSDEEYSEALQNLERCNWQVDYVITHCAPTSIARKESRHNEADRLTGFLQDVQDRTQYHYWLFGHYHDNRTINARHILLWELIVKIL